jgi:hypothetical protein
MTDGKPKPPYMVTMERDAKLKAALHTVVAQMTPRRARIEIEGTGGLALRASTEAKEVGHGKGGVTLFNPSLRRMRLNLVDKKGGWLSSAVSAFYPAEMEEQPEAMAGLRLVVADALVEGGADHRALDTVLDMRQMAARIKVRNAREVAAQLPAMEQDLADAEMAHGWVEAVLEEEAPSV